MADSSCHVKSRSDLAKMLRYVQAIIWDEAPMMSKYAVECVDRLLRELSEQPTLPFGGRLVVFGGDFRQTLPVVPTEGQGGIPSKILKTCS